MNASGNSRVSDVTMAINLKMSFDFLSITYSVVFIPEENDISMKSCIIDEILNTQNIDSYIRNRNSV